MEQDTDKLIEKQLATLPPTLQRAISLTPWRKYVSDVAAANNLIGDQAESLATETMLVMYGFDSQDNFAANLVRELSIEEGRAKMLAADVDQKVFSVVLTKANELRAETGKDTLQSAVDRKVVSPDMRPRLVYDPAAIATKRQINLIPAKPPEQKPIDLLPSSFPDEKPAREIETPRVPPTSYPGGNDPYRESFK